VVLQDPFLFTGTLAENIRLGNEEITDEPLRQAARDVNVLDFIESLPKGKFDEPVQERGNSLSTGQKQLINFARALAYNPRILILDEATSSVDTDTELRIRGALERMVEGRTSVLIAHRLSTVQRADTILVMHKGQLREMGSHQQLLARAASTGSSTSCSTRTRSSPEEVAEVIGGSRAIIPAALRISRPHRSRPGHRQYARCHSCRRRAGAGHAARHRRALRQREPDHGDGRHATARRS
jgi:ABC-type methionine transport system ATPase subunit